MSVKIFRIAVLLCFSILCFSCKEDPEPVRESPFFELFKESAIAIDTVAQANDTWEYGFAFSPLTNGKITDLAIKLPSTGSFTVTLWDLSGPSAAVLLSKSIQSATQHQTAASAISAVSVEKGKHYGLTILANSFYRITKTGGSAFTFPKTVGNISIESFREAVNNSSLAAFPATTNDTRLAPCVDVIFIAD